MNYPRLDELLFLTDPRIGFDRTEKRVFERLLYRYRGALLSSLGLCSLLWSTTVLCWPQAHEVSDSRDAPRDWMLLVVSSSAITPLAVWVSFMPLNLATRVKGRRSTRYAKPLRSPRFGVRFQRLLLLACGDYGYAGVALALLMPIPLFMLIRAAVFPDYNGPWCLVSVAAWCILWFGNAMRKWRFIYHVAPMRYQQQQCIGCGHQLSRRLVNDRCIPMCLECGAARRCEIAIDRA